MRCYGLAKRLPRTGTKPADVPGARWVSVYPDKFALVSETDVERVVDIPWSLHEHGYAVASIGGRQVRMHRLIMGRGASMDIDHANGDRLDNRRENLRLATASQNMSNSKRPVGATNPYRGVRAKRRRWGASIYHLNRNIYIGTFDSAEEAARARDAVARELHGAFARLNFPEDEVTNGT